MKKYLFAFTLAEVLIAIAIVGVIAGLVLPTTISRAQNRGFEQSYSRNVQTIEDAVNALIVSENKDFFKSVMFSNTTPSSYDNTSGEFIKKYLKVSRYCGSGTDNAKLCFPSTYFEYNGNAKEIYNPNFAGACAKLKNGASICLQPQIGATGAKGIIDLNGPSGPNVLNRDLREFSLISKTRAGKDKTQDSVAVTIAPDLGSESSDPCTTDPNSLECCQTISPPSTTCCSNYPSLPGCTVTPPPPSDPCTSEPKGLACCQKQGVTDTNKSWCCTFDAIKNSSQWYYTCHQALSTKVTWEVALPPSYGSQYTVQFYAYGYHNLPGSFYATISHTALGSNPSMGGTSTTGCTQPSANYQAESTYYPAQIKTFTISFGGRYCGMGDITCKIYYNGKLVGNSCNGSTYIQP